MTPAEHRAEADRLVRLCYTAEPMVPDEVLPDITISGGERYANMLSAAQVHATLALAPPPPPAQSPQAPQPQQRIDTSRPVFITDITATQIHISKSSQGDVYIAQENNDEDCAWGVVIDDPTQLRLFAAALTAHADRLEPKP